MIKQNNYTTRVSKAILFVAVAFIVFFHFAFNIPATDAGIYLYGSLLITKGYLPYKELWNNKPPLIYFIGTLGFLMKHNPFIGIRILELAILFLNLNLIKKITNSISLKSYYYQLSFCALYLIFWDQGFVTETFNIPIVLLSVYCFLKRKKNLEFLLTFFFLLCILLKQNSGIIVGIICLIDVFSMYRGGKTAIKIFKYLISILLYSTIILFTCFRLGILKEMFVQSLAYNILYFKIESPFRNIVTNPSISHILELTGFLLFALLLVLALNTYWKKFTTKEIFRVHDYFALFSVITFLIAFYPTYFTGRPFPHYFLLLIVPCCFVIGFWSYKSILVRSAVFSLLTIAIWANFAGLANFKKTEKDKLDVVRFIRDNTDPSDRIYATAMVDGFIYTMTNRLCCTRFVSPFYENSRYLNDYNHELINDLTLSRPKFILVNKVFDIYPVYYLRIVDTVLTNYSKAYENGIYVVYKIKPS